MYRMLSVLAITVAMTLWFQGGPAKGQAIPESLQQAGDDAAIKQRRNADRGRGGRPHRRHLHALR